MSEEQQKVQQVIREMAEMIMSGQKVDAELLITACAMVASGPAEISRLALEVRDYFTYVVLETY